jgi:hypothetical protein
VQLRQDACIDPVCFDAGMHNRAHLQRGVAMTTCATCGFKARTMAAVLPIASNTTSSVAVSALPKAQDGRRPDLHVRRCVMNQFTVLYGDRFISQTH